MLQKIKDGFQYGLGIALAMMAVSVVQSLLMMLLMLLSIGART